MSNDDVYEQAEAELAAEAAERAEQVAAQLAGAEALAGGEVPRPFCATCGQPYEWAGGVPDAPKAVW